MEELVYRPLFLRLARRAGRPLSGRGRFRSARPDALESLLALYFFLGGAEAGAVLLPRGAGFAGPELEFFLSAEVPGEGADWEGEGRLEAGSLRFAFSLGRADRLSVGEGEGGFARLVLPEGAAARYAALDRAECSAAGRESRILPARARARVQAFLGAGR